MKPDFYTKAVLTIIAIMLTVIACNQYVNPAATASAQGAKFAGVQFAGSSVDFTLFDTRTGDIWEHYYDTDDHKRHPAYMGKLTALDQPLMNQPPRK
jgi:hypothetical protein